MFFFYPENSREVIERAVPPRIRSRLVAIVERGYALADEALKLNPFLGWELGKDHRGYLRPISIGYLLKREIDQGNLPFRYTFELTKNQSHRYMVLHAGNTKITFSQVKHHKSIARPAYFRDKLQQLNQISMVFSGETIENSDDRYLLLTFSSGGEAPRFVNLGIADEKGWVDRVDMLKEIRLVDGGISKEKEVVIETEQLVGLKKFLKEVGEGGK